MALPSSWRSLLPLLVGLVVGVVGATLFIQSLPGGEGSPEQRAERLEVELKRAKNRLAALEGTTAQDRSSRSVLGAVSDSRGRRQLADGTRRIAEDLREGRLVNPDDIFRATQPLMRDLAPLFDRMRLRQQGEMIESRTGELARKYNLSPEKQEVLKQWFQKKAEDEARKWNELIARKDTTMDDVMHASTNVRPDEGLEKIMPSVLGGDQLAAFKSEQLTQRAERVQQEADRNVERLDGIVGLDEGQRDKVFGIMAASSKEYDPAMAAQGTQGPIPTAPVADRQAATLAVLRPEQRAAFEAAQQRRRDAAAKNMEAIGLALPANWDATEGNLFR